MFKQRPLLVFIAFALGVTPCVYANDTALNEGAYGPEPVGGFKGEESVIRMSAEHIEVEFGKEYSKVDAHFVFRSTKPGAPARQLVGFPDLSAAVKGFSEDIGGPIEDMRTYVDGKEVKSELKSGWYTVWVTFPPDRDVAIERKYRVPNGGSVLGDHTFNYITSTGASWKGTIGHLEADITLTDGLTIKDLAWKDDSLSETQKEGVFCSPNRSGWKILSPTQMRLVWDDFEPIIDGDKGGFRLATVATRRPDGSEIHGD